MENTAIPNNVRWTWADLVSSYRFWALVMFTILVSLNTRLFPYIAPFIMMDVGLTHKQFGILISSSFLGLFFSLIPAWIASRVKNYNPLYLFAFLMMLALLVCYFSTDISILIICAFFIGLSSSASTLLIATNIAKAVNSIEFFVLIFGLISLVTVTTYLIIPPLSISITVSMGYKSVFLIGIVEIFMAILLLLPAKKSLFNQSPPIRFVQGSGTKESHDSFTTFLLCMFIPFYIVYWCVRVHRDIRNYCQSAKLLTPTAAGWCALLVPFAIPIMLINLCDTMDGLCWSKKYSQWGLILLSIFLVPVAAAILQNKINQLNNVE